jgi:hypothetical protein
MGAAPRSIDLSSETSQQMRTVYGLAPVSWTRGQGQSDYGRGFAGIST